MSRPLRLISDSFPADPALDTAVSHALLRRVAGGELGDTLRLARPGAMLAFGKQDLLAPGFGGAVRAAREQGFVPVARLAGGRAAVFHEQTVAFAHATHDRDPRRGIRSRFDETAEIVAAALRRVGVDARVGEVPREYCPGEHSVNARGRRKLAGIGQRLIAGGAHAGGVVVVAQADRVRDVLVPVYRALRLDWDPDTAGGVADEVSGVDFEDVRRAILEEYAGRHELVEAELDAETLALAEQLAPQHALV